MGTEDKVMEETMVDTIIMITMIITTIMTTMTIMIITTIEVSRRFKKCIRFMFEKPQSSV